MPLFKSTVGRRSRIYYPGGEFGNDRGGHSHNGVDLECLLLQDGYAPGVENLVNQVYVSTGLGGNVVGFDHGLIDGSYWPSAADKHRHVTKHYHLGRKGQPLGEVTYVKVGDRVAQGQPFGKLGVSGNAVAPHDHYEHYIDGKSVDPLPWLAEYQTVLELRCGLMYPGSSGPPCRLMQSLLVYHGFPQRNLLGIILRPDGKYGPATGRALRKFQASRGLMDDGICGPLTWQALVPKF